MARKVRPEGKLRHVEHNGHPWYFIVRRMPVVIRWNRPIFQRTTRTWGFFLLGIWLIATGLLPMIQLSIPAAAPIMSLGAIAAGVLILLDR
jgi:hypothetical protein